MPMSNVQRNPTQKNHLRGIIFIQGSRKSGLRTICRRAHRRRSAKSQTYQKTVVRCNPKPYQQSHPLFVM